MHSTALCGFNSFSDLFIIFSCAEFLLLALIIMCDRFCSSHFVAYAEHGLFITVIIVYERESTTVWLSCCPPPPLSFLSFSSNLANKFFRNPVLSAIVLTKDSVWSTLSFAW